jgi:hypothetical protein
MHILIHDSYWLFWNMWPVIIFNSKTGDELTIDHVIDMT